MGYITAFIILVGFVGSVLTIYEFVNLRVGNSPKRSQKLALVFGTGTLILIVGALLSASTLAPSLNGPVNNPQPGTTVTAAPPTPSVTPTTNTSATVSPATSTPTAAAPGNGITLPYTITGKGNMMMTQTFPVGSNWSMAVSCSASGPLRPNQFEIAVVDTSTGMTIDNGPIDVPACSGPATIETIPEQQSGTFYLKITATPDITWTIVIQG